MTLKTVASRIGNGILDASAVMHNANLDTRINEIDEEIAVLRKQLTRLEKERSDAEDRKI